MNAIVSQFIPGRSTAPEVFPVFTGRITTINIHSHVSVFLSISVEAGHIRHSFVVAGSPPTKDLQTTKEAGLRKAGRGPPPRVPLVVNVAGLMGCPTAVSALASASRVSRALGFSGIEVIVGSIIA